MLADERDRIAGAEELLVARATDPHPRVRTEAVRGLSFFRTSSALAAVMAAANVEPSDRYVAYTADAALGATIPVWKKDYESGVLTAAGTPAGRILENVLGLNKKAAEIAPHIDLLMSQEAHSDEERNKAMQVLADIEGGSSDRGRAVFRRVCINCHKVGSNGADLGPDMTQVGKRLAGVKLVESIIDPNADVDAKYLSTLVVTDEGKSISGLLVSETPEQVVIFDGKEEKVIPLASIDERVKLKQSSMPEGLAATLSPNEFLDVIAYLKSLQ